MGIFNETPPTAGFPLTINDLLAVFPQKSGGKLLEDDFRQYLNVSYAKAVSSGTAAFYLILESLKERSTRKTVIIPSYICPLIPLAIKRAGLTVEVCDVNNNNFCYDNAMLAELCRSNNDILAILSVHLAGVPVDFDTIRRIAGDHDIFVIEDCAQALGARYRGNKVGTLGDAAFFSLSLGKGITTYEGGVIVTGNKELAEYLDRTVQRYVKAHVLSEVLLLLGLAGYWIFYRPLLFWFVFKLPQLFWNWRGNTLKAAMEDFTLDFPVHTISAARQRIGRRQFLRLDQELSQQRHKALLYLSELREIKGLAVVEELPHSEATYPFITLFFDSSERRAEAARALGKTLSGASFVYAYAIADYDYLTGIVPDRNCSNARSLSARALTLSTNTFLTDDHIAAVITTLKRI